MLTTRSVRVFQSVCSQQLEHATNTSGPPQLLWVSLRLYATNHRYYSVLIAMWMTQLHYDLRYQANDMLHRILKAGQILLFMYLASASGGWDLSVITPPRFLSQPDELDSSLAIEHGKRL